MGKNCQANHNGLLDAQHSLLSNQSLFYVTQAICITQSGKEAVFTPPSANELASLQIDSSHLYTGPLFWDIWQIQQSFGKDSVVTLPLDRVPDGVLPLRILPYAFAGDVSVQLSNHLAQRGLLPLHRPLRLVLFNGTGTMLGDTLVGLTAFKAVINSIRKVFPDIETQAVLAWNARPGVESIVQRCPDVQHIHQQAITLHEFCKFDAYWDFSALLALPGYNTIPLVDYYLQNLGVDPVTLPASEKVPALALDAELCSKARELLQSITASAPCILIHAQASNPLRSMPDAALICLLETLLESTRWRYVAVLNSLPSTIPIELRKRIIDLSEWSSRSINHFFAIMACMEALVTVDTLAVHAAAALRLPGVAVFSTIDPDLRVAYSPNLTGIRIPGAHDLPAWGRHKSGDDWPGMEAVYESAWLQMDWQTVLAALDHKIALNNSYSICEE